VRRAERCSGLLGNPAKARAQQRARPGLAPAPGLPGRETRALREEPPGESARGSPGGRAPQPGRGGEGRAGQAGDAGRELARAAAERSSRRQHQPANPCLRARLPREPEGTSINLEKTCGFLFFLVYFTVYLPFRAFVWRKSELLNYCCLFIFILNDDGVFLLGTMAGVR